MTKTEKLNLCVGCRNNFYNGPGNNTIGVKECWSLRTAKVAIRYRLGWWTRPDLLGAYSEVKTLDCHHEPGRYAFHKQLPDFVQIENVNRLEKK